MLASCSEERANRWKLANKFLTFFHHEINLVIGSESMNKLVTHLLRVISWIESSPAQETIH